eukprot:1147499-Prorocentrum_lima.AAC.1
MHTLGSLLWHWGTALMALVLLGWHWAWQLVLWNCGIAASDLVAAFCGCRAAAYIEMCRFHRWRKKCGVPSNVFL